MKNKIDWIFVLIIISALFLFCFNSGKIPGSLVSKLIAEQEVI